MQLACVASVSVQFGSKELQGDEWSSFFGSRPIFRAGKIPKTPFLGLSLLPNPTETLATQAIMQCAVATSIVFITDSTTGVKHDTPQGLDTPARVTKNNKN